MFGLYRLIMDSRWHKVDRLACQGTFLPVFRPEMGFFRQDSGNLRMTAKGLGWEKQKISQLITSIGNLATVLETTPWQW